MMLRSGVNVMGTEGGVAGRPFAKNRRFGVAPLVKLRYAEADAGDSELRALH